MAQTMSSNKDSTSSNNVFKDLNMTQEEISRFSEAFKKEEFRKLFKEYVEELQNPEQRALYEKEIAQLEEERGMDIEFIHPKPGHVLKLKEASGRKVFINICTSEKIQVATMQRTEKNGKVGGNWSIPHSFAPPREDTDKAKQTCLVIDTVFHPDTYLMASRNAQFKKMLEDTAVQGAERNFQLKFASNGTVKRPKMSFKGLPQATVIRRKRPDFDAKQAQLKTDPPNPFVQHYNQTQSGETPTSLDREFELQDRSEKKSKDSEPTKKDLKTTPKYQIKYSYQSDFGDFAYESPTDATDSAVGAGIGQKQPHSIQIVVELPGVSTAQAIDVDVADRELRVTSQQPGASYSLELRLAFPVTEDNGSAKFDRKAQRLTLTLPCIQQKPADQHQQQQQQQSSAAVSNPLIQELPDPPASAAPATSSGDCNAEPVAKEPVAKETVTKEPTVVSNNTFCGQLPPSSSIKCSQTDTHLTVLIEVKNVATDSIKQVDDLSDCGGCCWAASFASIGAGGWRSDFSLAVMQAELAFDFVQANPDNVLIRFAKTSKDVWLEQLTLKAQPTPEASPVVLHLSPNLNKSLADCLSRYAAPPCPPAPAAVANSSGLVVTELCGERLTVRLDGTGKDIRDKLVEVPVPQQQQQPLQQQAVQQQNSQSRLQGILKFTRSPSLSSSDDLSSSLSSSHGQALNQQQPLQQQQQQQNCGLNRSVSFSDHVESANYNTTASISAFHQTLRNRKKRQKQRETRRRRHNSDTSASAVTANEAPAALSSVGGGGGGGSASGSGASAARVRRVSEGCYVVGDQDDFDDEDFGGIDDAADDPVEAETVAAAAAAAASAAESPLSPPPPLPPQPQISLKASIAPPGSKVSQLTSSVIFELDDD